MFQSKEEVMYKVRQQSRLTEAFMDQLSHAFSRQVISKQDLDYILLEVFRVREKPSRFGAYVRCDLVDLGYCIQELKDDASAKVRITLAHR